MLKIYFLVVSFLSWDGFYFGFNLIPTSDLLLCSSDKQPPSSDSKLVIIESCNNSLYFYYFLCANLILLNFDLPNYSYSSVSLIHPLTIFDWAWIFTTFWWTLFLVSLSNESSVYLTGSSDEASSFWMIARCFNLSFRFLMRPFVFYSSTFDAFWSSIFLNILLSTLRSNYSSSSSWLKNLSNYLVISSYL